MHRDLIAWLRAQLDADERLARACIPDNGEGHWMLDREVAFSNPALADKGIRMIGGWEPTLPHIANWDPLRVLAEVRAKRAILELHDTADGLCTECGSPELGFRVEAPCPTVRLIAYPLAGRDGWRDEWSVVP